MTDNELVPIVGFDGSRALRAFARGGALFIPRDPGPDSWLVCLLGATLAGRLARHCGGQELRLPGPPVAAARRALIRELRADGHTVIEIAARVGLSRRRVWELLER